MFRIALIECGQRLTHSAQGLTCRDITTRRLRILPGRRKIRGIQDRMQFLLLNCLVYVAANALPCL